MKKGERILVTGINVMMLIGFAVTFLTAERLQNAGADALTMLNITAGAVSLLGLSFLELAHSLEIVTDRTGARFFGGMILLCYCGVFCDTLSWAIDGFPRLIALEYVLNAGGFLALPLLLLFLWNYQSRQFIGESERSINARRIVRIAAAADVLFILAGTVTGYLFSVDGNGFYVEGKGLPWVHLCPTVIIACGVYENLKRKLPLRKKLSLLAFGLAPAAALLFAIPLPQYDVIYVAMAADLILIYGTVQTKKEQELAEKNAEIAERDRELEQLETQIMISQIRPHFLYNTLSSIVYLCDADKDLAKKTVRNFSAYLRANMDSIGAKDPIPFEKELAHTKNYLEIEKLRFGDALNVEFGLEVTDFEIPALTLQPLAENAVRYGVRSREEGGTVRILTKRENGKVYLTVSDDGMGFDVNGIKDDGRSHVGLANTRRRLKQMMDADLIIDSRVGEGTTVTVVIGERDETVSGGADCRGWSDGGKETATDPAG